MIRNLARTWRSQFTADYCSVIREVSGKMFVEGINFIKHKNCHFSVSLFSFLAFFLTSLFVKNLLPSLSHTFIINIMTYSAYDDFLLFFFFPY